VKTRLLAVLVLAILLCAFLTACVDKSKPWRDDGGQLHDQYVCHIESYTTYTTIKHGDTTIQVPHQNSQRVCEYV
jgi:outer membrane biogenesis lipoprotein LolB